GLDTRGMTPREIDDYVRGQLAAGGDLYTLHERALADLRPDLILTQDLCRVCALPSGQVEAALTYLGCEARVLTLDPRSLGGVLGGWGPGRGRPGERGARRRAAHRGGPDRAPGAPESGGGRVGGPAVHRRALGARPGGRGRGDAGRGAPGRAFGRGELGRDR